MEEYAVGIIISLASLFVGYVAGVLTVYVLTMASVDKASPVKRKRK